MAPAARASHRGVPITRNRLPAIVAHNHAGSDHTSAGTLNACCLRTPDIHATHPPNAPGIPPGRSPLASNSLSTKPRSAGNDNKISLSFTALPSGRGVRCASCSKSGREYAAAQKSFDEGRLSIHNHVFLSTPGVAVERFWGAVRGCPQSRALLCSARVRRGCERVKCLFTMKHC